MIKLINVVGARPQIIKAAAISRAIKADYAHAITDVVVHTGQHYDANMSGGFFDQLSIPAPSYNLACGSLSHAKQTALIMERFEEVLEKEQPHAVLVYGDTNSTLAASLTAVKMGIDVLHVEAGLRSFNKSMPEEVNRIMCDHVSSMLFCPTQTAIDNLSCEGIKHHSVPGDPDRPVVYHCGDVMYDNSLHFAAVAKGNSKVMSRLGLASDQFVLFTMHRDLNTDNAQRLNAIVSAVINFVKKSGQKVVFPMHPRTSKMIKQLLEEHSYKALYDNDKIILTEPLGFFDIIELEKHCHLVVTDSGGVQKEAYFFEKPCVVMRPETEWVELVEGGNAVLADADAALIEASMLQFPGHKQLQFPPIYGDGQAAHFICQKVVEQYQQA
ncbi:MULTISPECIES: non-hydrolyzing UDP-N-acetylglucosamine 2-epimerase [unclassified Carboxylicivirga]|uniref:non-hydrolyzing UDP-N-acetylglucosamine 2-epimerase n=1 Tax=Carboxylicivirga TaxID=1628153 RepID=UPI003D33F83A